MTVFCCIRCCLSRLKKKDSPTGLEEVDNNLENYLSREPYAGELVGSLWGPESGLQPLVSKMLEILLDSCMYMNSAIYFSIAGETLSNLSLG